MAAEDVAVWMIGVGSLTIAVGLIFGSERPFDGLVFRGPFNTRADRLRFAVEAAGASFVAVGSLVFAIENPPSPVLLVFVPVLYVIVHATTAWKLRQYWLYRLGEAETHARGDAGPNELVRRQLECARECATWRWVIRHTFSGEYWPTPPFERPAK